MKEKLLERIKKSSKKNIRYFPEDDIVVDPGVGVYTNSWRFILDNIKWIF